MCSLRNSRVFVVGFIFLAVGCSAATPEKKLLGKWLGAPGMDQAVNQAVDAAAQGQKVNALARGAAQFLGRKLAEATMSVEVDFHKGGTVFFRGNTDVLGFPPDSDGTWEVSEAGSDLIRIAFGTDRKQLQGKVLFRDKDEFTLKLDNTDSPPSTEVQSKETPKTNKPPLPRSIVFKRNKD